MDNTIVRPMAVGAYGGTPGRNALRPYASWAGYRKIRMFFLPKIFESIRDRLRRMCFSTSSMVSVPSFPLDQNVDPADP